AEHGEEDHRADQDAAGTESRAERRCMNALIEAFQAEKPEAADQGKRGAGDHEEGGQHRGPHGNVAAFHHSITSPRIRNLARATVATKPSKAMTRAISKYSVLPVRMPNVSSSSIALT